MTAILLCGLGGYLAMHGYLTAQPLVMAVGILAVIFGVAL